jgi:hypothetical protein
MPIASATARPSLPRGLTATFAPWTGVVLLSLLWFMAGTLLLRRLAGAFEVPLSPLGLLVVGAMSATLAAVVRLTWPVVRTSSHSMPSAEDRRAWEGTLHRAFPTSALLVIGIALSLPETSLAGIVALWTFLLLEELWAWLPAHTFFRRSISLRLRGDGTGRMNGARVGSAGEEKIHRETASGDVARDGMERGLDVDAAVMQKMVRTIVAEGEELIRGQLRVQFVPGQRTAAAHVAFCPSFDQTPQVEFRQASGPDTRVKLAQIYPYGARFDLKLAAVAAESTSVVLDFSVTGKSVAIL